MTVWLFCRLIFAIELGHWECVNDLGLNFHGQTFQLAIVTIIGCKMQALLLPSGKMSSIYHRMTLLRKLHAITYVHIRDHEFWQINIWKTSRNCYFYRGWYLVLSSFSRSNILLLCICYINNLDVPTDLPRLTRPPPLSCSCFIIFELLEAWVSAYSRHWSINHLWRILLSSIDFAELEPDRQHA